MWKAFPDSISMQRSFWITCHGQQKQKITAKVYESLKQNLSFSEESKQKMSIAKIGKPHSDDRKHKMSIAKIGKPSHRKGKKISEDHRRKISNSLKR